MFRTLTPSELRVVETLQTRGKLMSGLPSADKLLVDYSVKGNVTVAFLKTGKSSGEVLTSGWAKKNPKDKCFLPEVGQAVAFARALRVEEVLPEPAEEPVEEPA